MRRLVLLLTVVLALLGAAPAGAVTPPPTGTDLDYQLGGERSVPAARGDRGPRPRGSPVPGRYNVCYVNGFQTQPGERALWRRHPRLVLRDHGRPVVDEAWGEWLLDVRTAAKRKQLAASSAGGPAAAPRPGTTRGVRQPRLVHAQPRPDQRGAGDRVRPAAGARARTAPAWPPGRRTSPTSTAPPSATTSRSPRSAAATASAGATCGTSGGGCWRSSTGARTSAGPAPTYGDRLAVVLRDRDLSPTGVRRFC